MKKNKDDLPAIFQKHQTTLKETSHNDAAGQYMTDFLWQVIDFDAVKTDYMRAYHCDPIPASNDALLYRDGKYFFIEFKDGNMRTEIHEVKRKIFESLLLFGDITDTTISYLRENVSYILVYNKQKSQAYIRTRQKRLFRLMKYRTHHQSILLCMIWANRLSIMWITLACENNSRACILKRSILAKDRILNSSLSFDLCWESNQTYENPHSRRYAVGIAVWRMGG